MMDSTIAYIKVAGLAFQGPRIWMTTVILVEMDIPLCCVDIVDRTYSRCL